MKILRRFGAGMLLVVFAYSWASPVWAVPISILTNSGAETGDFTGWLPEATDEPWTISSDAYAGTKSFLSGNETSVMTQTLDLLEYGYTEAQLDSITGISLSVRVKGNDDGGEDDSYDVGLQMLGSGLGAMAITSLPEPRVATAEWTGRTLGLGSYGPGMRHIRVIASTTDGAGAPGNHGAMFDEFVLTIADDSAPMLSSVSPADNATNVSGSTSLTLNFSEAVTVGTGDIVIHRTSDDVAVATIDVTTEAVTGSGTDQISVALPQSLLPGVEYYVTVDEGAFVDPWNNAYVGISSSTAWSFRTFQNRGSSRVVMPQVRDTSIAQVQAVYRSSTSDVMLSWQEGDDVPAARVLASVDGVLWEPISDYLVHRGAYMWRPSSMYIGKTVTFMVEATDLATRLGGGTSSPIMIGETEAVMADPAEDGLRAGAFIRTANKSTVYYVDETLHRRPILDAQTFFTWQSSFESVVTVSDEAMAAIPLGRTLLPKPDTVLVKIQSVPHVYVLTARDGDTLLRRLPDEATAVRLFGKQWNDYVIDVSPANFGDFIMGDPISGSDVARVNFLRRRVELHEALLGR